MHNPKDGRDGEIEHNKKGRFSMATIYECDNCKKQSPEKTEGGGKTHHHNHWFIIKVSDWVGTTVETFFLCKDCKKEILDVPKT